MLRRSTRNRKRRLSSDHEAIRQKFQSRHSCSEQSSDHHMKRIDEEGIIICDNLPYIATESCPMCQFIKYNIQSYNLGKNTSFELRLFSSRKSFSWLYRSHEKYLDTTMMLAVVPKHIFAREGSPSDFIRSYVPEFLIPGDPSPYSLCVSGRSINTTMVDFGFIRKSLSYCMEHHHHHCDRPAYSIQGSITVYDYKNNRTLDVKLPCLYIALSYVWGDAGRKEERTRRGHTRRPKVIEDCITIADHLKIPYIWVDKYCIDQTNPHKKQQQLNSMYAIYNNAYLTVVDGAGSDMHCGLFGVSMPRTRSQVRVQFGDQSWISTLRNPQALILNCPWNSRGWTYQEAIASPRLLIFTEEQVYFECKAMRCWESLYISLDSHHCRNKSTFKDSLCEPIFCQETRNPTEFEGRTDFPRYIKSYTCRTLTNSYDALNAITGVLGLLEKGNEPVYNFWGIPLYATTPGDSSAVTTGMAWTLQDRQCKGSWRPILRRLMFPSWSWTGWEGVVGSFELGNLNHATNVSIGIQTAKNSEISVPWGKFWESEGGMKMDRRTNLWASGLGLGSERKEYYNYPWLEITAGIFQVSLQYITACEVEKMTAKDPTLNGDIKPGFYIVPPSNDACLTPVVFPQNYPELRPYKAVDICRQQWDCMLLGYCDNDFPVVIMLNHDRRRKVTERVWGGRLRWGDGWKDKCHIEKRCVRLH
ncbi:heterokaryon incompatibility protein-domain-containing protein [Aspergillus pseudocaelatus]|uniref:Heterokaryon incompatibility protein-domain-containing protein n=1 Tax=Aspergillus pseudocaelatus TaxID=1825620 RepID=A0ABQ6X0L1_9EURO|nr:heterokaryon incompatibility protein-domain-containing protein [Aspergillus pseudocaelatus]